MVFAFLQGDAHELASSNGKFGWAMPFFWEIQPFLTRRMCITPINGLSALYISYLMTHMYIYI